MMKRGYVLLVAALVSGCEKPHPPSSVTDDWQTLLGKADARRGADVWQRGPQAGGKACQSCHGPAGQAIDAEPAPRLTGQDRLYLARQLSVFARSQRQYHTMQILGRTLSPQEIADVVTWLAQARAPAAALPALDPRLVAAGGALYGRGDGGRNIPACAGCHGTDGRHPTEAGTPYIAGQPTFYLTEALTDLRARTRVPDSDGQNMFSAAHNLSNSDIAALAAYLASLAPAATGPGRTPPAPRPIPSDHLPKPTSRSAG
jgi:cytochrome c553